jgi:hypothetical protein
MNDPSKPSTTPTRTIGAQNLEPIPARCVVRSDRGKMIAFQVVDLVEVFESWILGGIVDLCLEQSLDLDDDSIWD